MKHLKMLAVVLLLAAPFLATQSFGANQDQPTIAKDSVQVTAFTFNVYKQNYDIWSWVPLIQYRVNGPIPSASQLYGEFTVPGPGPWAKFDCMTANLEKAYWGKTKCAG